MSAGVSLQLPLHAAVADAAERAATALVRQQDPSGYWCAELTADSTLESDFHPARVMEQRPQLTAFGNMRKAAEFRKQWRQSSLASLPMAVSTSMSKGPSEISASCKAYFALKVAGVPVADSRMERSCAECILALGGLQAANSYVKVNLSLFDLYPREHTPSIPPELMLLPGGVIYQMSSWTRAIVIALAIVHSANPKRPVPAGFTLDELHVPGKSFALPSDDSWITLRNTFIHSDRILKLWEKYGVDRIRRSAIRKCEHWMVEHLKHSDGLGAIYPPMMYAIMAFDVLGYAVDHPMRKEAVRQFENLLVDDGERFFFQPCFSPVWDTAIASYALGEARAGSATEAVQRRTADWLVSREIRRPGDWSVKRSSTEPSGWAFEFRNDHYPDIDDTAMVLLSFKHARSSNTQAQSACEKRALNWLLAMQSRDGGWAAFDVDNNWEILSYVPFADHNAMLDPTCADITGRVFEALGAHGMSLGKIRAVQRGVDYLIRTQTADGSWYGRWGVAYIYGTCFALRGLQAAGEDDHEPHISSAPTNGFVPSSMPMAAGVKVAPATTTESIPTPAPLPPQTAWAILGLIAGGDVNSSSLQHGIEYLIETQGADGQWPEELATGTGFPKVFYLNYHMYRLYFPLLALSAYTNTRQ